MVTLWVRDATKAAENDYMLLLLTHVEATNMMGVPVSTADAALKEMRDQEHHTEVRRC